MAIRFIELLATAFIAASGALMAGRRRMDWFGVVVIAVITSIGGGTLRDLLLGRAVFWVNDPVPLFVAAVTGMFVLIIGPPVTRIAARRATFIVMADAVGMAMFTVLGARVALACDKPASIAALMGVITGVAGGMTRDVLCGRTPLVLRREIYATASLAGAAVYVLSAIRWPTTAIVLAMTITFAIRVWAVSRGISLPTGRLLPRGHSSDAHADETPNDTSRLP